MAGSRFVVPASVLHVPHVAHDLRQADVDEVWASHHLNPEQAVSLSLYASDLAYSVLSPDTGLPFAMFGVKRGSMLGGESVVWLLSTPEIKKWRSPFAKRSREYVREMADRYDVLTNHVDVRNKASIAWLKWLGAEFDDPAPWGEEGLDFTRFEIRREKICA